MNAKGGCHFGPLRIVVASGRLANATHRPSHKACRTSESVADPHFCGDVKLPQEPGSPFIAIHWLNLRTANAFAVVKLQIARVLDVGNIAGGLMSL